MTFSVPAGGQTTQGIIVGRVYELQSQRPIPGATVTYFRLAEESRAKSWKAGPDSRESIRITGHGTSRLSNRQGVYALPFLSPGKYLLKVFKDGYQPAEAYPVEVDIASRVELDFRLRSLQSDLKRRSIYKGVLMPGGEVVNYFGADVGMGAIDLQEPTPKAGTLEPSLSYVIDPQQVQELPLLGRDVYPLVGTVPGVTADVETTGGVGLSISGQRPRSSNYLLDGVENNDPVNTGPLTVVAPEAVEAYRVSTNSFSAEFGRTSGLVANAVTKGGSDAYHGVIYGYLNNEILNANAFQLNIAGVSRRPRKELYAGFWVGGPALRDRLLFSTAFERLRRRSRLEPVAPDFPSSSVGEAPARIAGILLDRFPPPFTPSGSEPTVRRRRIIEQPASEDRSLLLQRFDFNRGEHRIEGRLALSRSSLPDFIFSPYPDFTSGLKVTTTAVAVNETRWFGPNTTNQLRFGWRQARLGWDRANPEIPTLKSGDEVLLPGSPAQYVQRERGNTWEIGDSLALIRGGHVITLGGGLYLLGSDSVLALDRVVYFDDVSAFLADRPRVAFVPAGRAQLRPVEPQRTDLVPPRPDYRYWNSQFFGFFQDSLKLGTRIGLSFGVRYDSFGSPRSRGRQDSYLRPGPGASIEERLTTAAVVSDDPGHRRAYRPDRNDWAGRVGISYDLGGRGSSVIRGAYGIFYDRPFDNLTRNIRNNNLTQAAVFFPGLPLDYLLPIDPRDPSIVIQDASFPELVWIDQGLRTARSHNWFGGVERRFSSSLSLQVSLLGASAPNLVATDRVNRVFSRTPSAGNFLGRIKPDLEDIVYRSNLGFSSYQALGALLRYRSARGHQFQISYTLGRSLDNQSDPLAGQVFTLTTQASSPLIRSIPAAFTRQFDNRLDHGYSDFHQRHNLVFYSIWELGRFRGSGRLGRLLNGWQFAQLASIRSGFPYTVFVSGSSSLIRNRPNLAPGRRLTLERPLPFPGGKVILDASAFLRPPPDVVGALGRNSLVGPGFWNLDASLARSFSLPLFRGEQRLQLRADFFNVLNQANLGNPDANLDSLGFGRALYGRTSRDSSQRPGVSTPLSERHVQVQLKLSF